MKNLNLKRLLFILLIFVIFNIPAFARSGFEFILNIPIGASYSIISQNMKDYEMKNSFGLDAGVEAQLGYMFQIKEGFGISVLGEIGFAHDNYIVKFKNDYYLKDYTITYNSLQIGLFPKFNIGKFSIGIGGGIKIPIFLGWDYTINANAKTIPNYSLYSAETGGGESSDGWICGTPDEDNWVDYVYMYGEGKVKQTPLRIISYAYIKLTFDYSVFFTDRVAMNIGLYFGYDFFPDNNIRTLSLRDVNYFYYEHKDTEKPRNYGTFNFGIQLGFRFGPRV